MFPGLSTAYWLTLHGLATVVAILLYVIASHALHQRRHPSAAIAWVLFILLMPYVALPAFLTFGSRKQARPRNRTALLAADPAAPGAEGSWAVQTAAALGQPAPAAYHALQLHADGHEALAALWQVIDGAAHTIDVCTFIVGDDALGAQVIERLCVRARAGVKVRLMLDGLGRLMGGRPDLKPLRACGGEVTLFVPPLHSPLKGRTNLRDHRKLLIADAAFESRRLWSGGRNLASEYFEGAPGKAPWHDLSFDLAGQLVLQAQALFAMHQPHPVDAGGRVLEPHAGVAQHHRQRRQRQQVFLIDEAQLGLVGRVGAQADAQRVQHGVALRVAMAHVLERPCHQVLVVDGHDARRRTSSGRPKKGEAPSGGSAAAKPQTWGRASQTGSQENTMFELSSG